MRFQPAPLWELVGRLEHHSLDAWTKQHHRPNDLETSLTQHVNIIETTCERRPGGRATVTVSVIADRVSDHAVHYFSLQRTKNGRYEVKASTFD